MNVGKGGRTPKEAVEDFVTAAIVTWTTGRGNQRSCGNPVVGINAAVESRSARTPIVNLSPRRQSFLGEAWSGCAAKRAVFNPTI